MPNQYHPRRTLDQYYYSRKRDTTQRDADQVVYRQTRPEAKATHQDNVDNTKTAFDQDLALPGKSKVIMVDQLWLCLWIIEKKESPTRWQQVSSAVLTAFPYTAYPRSAADPPNLFRTADVRQSVLETVQRDQDTPHQACKIASTILSTALFETLSISEDWSLNFKELFREAISNMTEKHDEVFREFDAAMAPGENPISVKRRRE